MSIPWFQQPEAQAVIDRLQPSDLSIQRDNGSAFFYWQVDNEEIDTRLDLFLDRATDEEVGFSFKECHGNYEKCDRWVKAWEKLPSVNAVLNTKFGDPNLLLAYGLEGANRIWKVQPAHLFHLAEQEKQRQAMVDFIDQTERDKHADPD